MLPADVYARFLRQRGAEVLFICATDEHGTPAELAAMAAGMDVASYCEVQHRIQADIYARFGLSFDYFGRTSSIQNHALTKEIFAQLDSNGFIESRTIQQVYSVTDGRFLPDRYVIGTCPYCNYDSARGDQCENCTRLLDPTDLIDPRSAISGSRELETRETEHLFLRLSALADRVRDWIRTAEQDWPPLTRQIAWKWLNEGLRDRSITRDLTWGIKVPKPGFGEKVFYVWFDAPIGYIGATAEWSAAQGEPNSWQDWWRGADDVRYTQFMGKDNLPFHTVMFPAMLLGASPEWKLSDQIKGFHWLDYYGGKFSTSAGRGVFTDRALELFPADYWRYFLVSSLPESSDSTFSWELFADTINKDLAGTLGNFIHRVLQFAHSRFNGAIPIGGLPGTAEEQFQSACDDALARYHSRLTSLDFRAAIRELRQLWTLGNQYIHDRAPWTLIKTDPAGAALAIRTCFNAARIFALAAEPIIPALTDSIMNALQLTADERRLPNAEPDWNVLVGGRIFVSIPPLVRRIEDAEVAALKREFGG